MPSRSNSSIQDYSYKKTIKKEYCHFKVIRLRRKKYDQVHHHPKNEVIHQKVTSNTIEEMVGLIKDVINRLNYSLDTYFACLLILDSFKSYVNEDQIKLVAFTIVNMAAKVYESELPGYSQLIKWGKGKFDREQLVLAQAYILKLNDYSVPIITQNFTPDEIQGQILKLQEQLLCLHFDDKAKK